MRRLIATVLICALALQATGAFAAPNDPDLGKLWYLDALDIRSVWEREMGTSEVVVAVIDAGIDIYHPDLRDAIWVNQREISGDGIDNDHNGYVDDIRGWDFVDDDNDPRPNYTPECFEVGGNCFLPAVSHGTFVAGVIAATANNGIGIAGIAPGVKIMPLRALDHSGSGNVLNVVRAIRYAIENGASIINLSIVGYMADEALRQAVVQAHALGVLVVAAAGNAGSDGSINLDQQKAFPICFTDYDGASLVLGVAATDERGRLAGFSNYGPSCVDVVAPGRNFYGLAVQDERIPVLSSQYTDGYSGTSVAAPVVSAVAALVKSRVRNITPSSITAIIRDTAVVPVDLRLSDFIDATPRGIIDPNAVLDLLDSSTHPLGDRLALIPLGGSDGRVLIVDDRGNTTNTFNFSSTARSGAHIATRGATVYVSGADGKNSVSTYRSLNGVYQLTGYRGVFTESTPGPLSMATGVTAQGQRLLAMSTPPGTVTTVTGFTSDWHSAFSFGPFGESYRAGVSVALGNVDGDATLEAVVGAAPGHGPQVRIVEQGMLQGQFFAFDERARHGVEVAVGNVRGDERDEIIVTTRAGVTARVRIFDATGIMLGDYTPFGATFRGGIQAVVGDFHLDDGLEIALLPLSGRAPIIIINGAGRELNRLYPMGADYAGGFRGVAAGKE